MNKKDLNEVDLTELTRLLSLDPEALTDRDVDTLNARRDYLTNEEKRIFASVLRAEGEVEDPLVEIANPKEVKEAEIPVASVPTRRELSDKAIALGVDGELVKRAKTNAEIEELIVKKQDGALD